LPYVFIRERSGGAGGVHLIGLDGSTYLSAAQSGTSFGTLNSAPNTQERENDILKFRSFQDSTDSSNGYTGGSFDFTGAGIKDYFGSNEDQIILQLANASVAGHDTTFDYDYGTAIKNQTFDDDSHTP
jgi:hypothetical protein